MRNPVTIGRRVYLRAMETDDAEAWARFEAEETDTFMWRASVPTSPMERLRQIRDSGRVRPPSDLAFAVCLREDDRYIGMVGVVDVDWQHRTGETFSDLGPVEFRGKGYGSEAKHLLLELCFERLGLHVICSEVSEANTRSAAALAKQGYRRAGVRRWFGVKNGRYVDHHVFDLTRDDWRAAHAAWLAAQDVSGEAP